MLVGYCFYRIVTNLPLKEIFMVNVKQNKIINAISSALGSFYFTPVLLVFGFCCWAFKLTTLVVSVFCLAFVLVLVFCEDKKNIFTPLFFVAFFIPDILTNTNYTVYFIGAGGAVAFLLGYVIYRLIKDRKTIKCGKFLVGLLFSFVAFFLSGIIGRFNFVRTAIILGFCLAITIFYLISVNYTKNLKEYLQKLFVVGAVIVGIQITRTNLLDELAVFFSAIGLNTAVLFVVLGIIACYTLAFESKYDYLYFALALVLTVSVVFSRCRVGMLLTALVDVVFTIMLFLKSKNKAIIVATFLLAGLVFGLVVTFSETVRESIIRALTGKKGLSGRESLWAFCLDRFKEYPIFGYGFFYDDVIPSLRGDFKLILAHNTFLQWLCCTGIVGTLIMIVFYANKYSLLCRGFNRERIFVFTSAIMVELSGMIDQAATIDPFLPILVIILVSCVEQEKGRDTLIQGESLIKN